MEKADNALDKVEVCLIAYSFHLQGMSSRQIAEMDTRLKSHNTINQNINTGRQYFRAIFPLIRGIKKLLKENNLVIKEFPSIYQENMNKFEEIPFLFDDLLNEGKVKPQLSENEWKKLNNEFGDNENIKDLLPVLFSKIKESQNKLHRV